MIPTGGWSKGSFAKLGSDEFTFMPDLGGTWYFDKTRTTTASVLARYEVHSAKRNTDIHMGNDFHFEWGVGKTVGKIFTFGPVGYAQFKTTDDSGKDVTWDPRVHDRVFGIGPEIGLPVGHTGFYAQLRGLAEFGAHSRATTNSFVVVLTKRFNTPEGK